MAEAPRRAKRQPAKGQAKSSKAATGKKAPAGKARAKKPSPQKGKARSSKAPAAGKRAPARRATGKQASQARKRPSAKQALTVAVTGPTGDIGRAFMRALEGESSVERVVCMARSPFDPKAAGWTKAVYRRGDVLDRASVDALVDDADVVVHLAFIILGGGEETHRINLEGSRNVFEAAVAAGAKRLVYTSSVAAYGFHADAPQPLSEEDGPRGSEGFYYSAQKAELERVLEQAIGASGTEPYVFRPCIVAGPSALTLVEEVTKGYQLGGRLPVVQRALEGMPFMAPVLPDPGVPFQLVHEDDVAQALTAAVAGRGKPGAYNLAAEDSIRVADVAREFGWWSVPIPHGAIRALADSLSRLPGLPSQLSWLNALRVPVLMDTSKTRRELDWKPKHTSAETLHETVVAARREGLLG